MSCKSIDFNLRGFRSELEAVGTDVAIKHLAPTLLGMSVEITAAVMAVEGRRVIEISAKDDIERLSTGTHAVSW